MNTCIIYTYMYNMVNFHHLGKYKYGNCPSELYVLAVSLIWFVYFSQ